MKTFKCILRDVFTHEVHDLLWFYGWHTHRPSERFVEPLITGEEHTSTQDLQTPPTFTPCAIYFWLFGTRKHEVLQRIDVSTLIGCVMLPWPLTSVTQEIIWKEGGRLELTWLAPMNLHTIEAIGNPLPDYTKPTRMTYERYQEDFLTRFTYARLPMGQEAIIAFAWFATQIHSTPANTEALFTNLHTLARLNQPARYSQGNLLSDMLTLLTRCGLYTVDRRLDQHTGVCINEDQWVSLSWFPDPAKAAFDCEDAAEAVLELFHAFVNHSKFQNTEMEMLRVYARGYTPFFTMGTLRCKDANNQDLETPHAYVTLLDQRWVTAQLAGQCFTNVSDLQPAIVVEATSYTEGCWDITPGLQTVTQEADACAVYTKDALWRKILKFRAPLQYIQETNMYMNVSGLITADYVQGAKRSCLHLLCTTGGKAVKVAAKDLFTYQDNVHCVLAFEPLDAKSLEYTRFGTNVPRTTLPEVAMRIQTAKITTAYTKRFDIPTRIYEQYKEEIHTHLGVISHRQDYSLTCYHHLTQLYL